MQNAGCGPCEEAHAMPCQTQIIQPQFLAELAIDAPSIHDSEIGVAKV